MTFESAQFDADLFALASNQTFADDTVTVMDAFELPVVGGKVTLTTSYAVKPATAGDSDPVVSINGLKLGTGQSADEGKFLVGESTGGTDGAAYSTEITFNATDVANVGSVTVYVERTLTGVQAITVDNQQTFVGSCLLKWPVYSSGDEEGLSAGGVKGYMFRKIFKCRCTAAPGFDTQYKSGMTPGITIAAMDPHRSDGGIWQDFYIEKARL